MAYLSSPSFAPLPRRGVGHGFLARMVAAMAESRMRAARRALNARGHLVDDTKLTLGDVRSRTADRPFDR